MQCPQCQLSFEKTGNYQKFCSRKCCRATYRSRHRTKLVTPVSCCYCGQPFIQSNRNQRFCSSKCCKKAWRAPHRINVIEEVKCAYCEQPFIRQVKCRKYCSDKCKNAATNNKPEQRLKLKVYNHSAEAIAARKRRYNAYRTDPTKVLKQQQRVKNWYRQNKRQFLDWNRGYMREKRRVDPWWNIRNRLASRVWHAVTGANGKKAFKTQELLGCSIAEFRRLFESKFKDGMSWDKFLVGEIHIDHIIPCVEFDLTDPDQQKRCFHYTNLQPLWKADNLSKGSKTPCEELSTS